MAKACAALIVLLCLAFPAGAAQQRNDVKKAVRPAWSELTLAQQQVLAPLQPYWEEMDAPRRRKWVQVAARYPKMKPQEQQRLQERMKEWAKLTPEQRKAAREKYQTLKKLPPSKRQEVANEWERYQRSLAQQQRKEGAPLEPSLTDRPEPAPEVRAPEAPAADTTTAQ
jgi:hypothetical protein